MTTLELRNVSKKYPTFNLNNVSFKVESNSIMGFIGRNGAGKTTTLKSILNLIHIDGGEVFVFGKNFLDNEKDIKENLAFILGGIDYYPLKKLKVIADVVKRFYVNWDNDTYNKYIKLFGLDQNKKVKELSNGMKVKFNLALALSHKAKLLILDEPTSGLDPVSRSEILEIFEDLVDNENVSILFSTQIVSDLEKCADSITYIKNGEIVESDFKSEFVKKYLKISGESTLLEALDKNLLIGLRNRGGKFEALIKVEDFNKKDSGFNVVLPTIEDVMVFNERNGEKI